MSQILVTINYIIFFANYIMRETQKVGRAHRDRKRRVAPKDKSRAARRIVREPPPKKQKKVVATQELVKNPRTGNMEYKDVYKVQEVRDPERDRKLEKTLYIPKTAPEKERKYLRYVPPQFRDATKRYDNPAKYGDLSLYKKARVMQIAKDKYDLTDKLAKHLDKDDLIRYIKKRHKKADTFRDEDYLPTKIKMRKVEPIRKQPIEYQKKKGFDATIKYGKGSNNLTGNTKLSSNAFQDLNRKLDTNPKYAGLARFGTFREMSEKKYNKFLEGNLPKDEMQSELLTHLSINDPSIIITLDDKQLSKLYKKTYKMSKKSNDERFSKTIHFPKFKQSNSGNFSKAPVIKDPTGKPFVLGQVDLRHIISPIARPNVDFDSRKIFGDSKEELKRQMAPVLGQWIKKQNDMIRAVNKHKNKVLFDKLTLDTIKEDIKDIMKDQIVSYNDAVKILTSENLPFVVQLHNQIP